MKKVVLTYCSGIIFVLEKTSVFGQLVSFGTTVAVGGLVYALGLIVLKVEEVWTAIRLGMAKIGFTQK
ncbi:MAG: hypothetical protein DDT37_01515 [Firmicutes bacterium]|nr:hypothetical protein [candidate division NPL-UPA2 bacterium]